MIIIIIIIPNAKIVNKLLEIKIKVSIVIKTKSHYQYDNDSHNN